MRRFIGLAVTGALVVAVLASPAQARKRYIAFGDSITDGFGDPSGRGYPPRLERQLQKNGDDPDVEVIKSGMPSEDSGEALARINSVLDAENGDALLLMLGTNDVSKIFDGLSSRETAISNLDELARRATRRDMEVVHATILPRPRGVNRDVNNFITRFLSHAIRELAFQRKRRLVDIFHSLDPDLVPNRQDFYFSEERDPVGHPNADGYTRIAGVFADVLLGIDSVPPVMGDFFPGPPEVLEAPDILAGTEIRISLYEPRGSSGIDLENTKLLINGRQVGEIEGNERKIELVHRGAKAMGCRARIEVVAPDLEAEEPNVFDRQIAVYELRNRSVLKGDVDFDCRVDGFDLVQLGLKFGARGNQDRFDEFCDFNGDGMIDGEDLAVLGRNFGRSSR